MEHGQKINSYNFSRMKYPNVQLYRCLVVHILLEQEGFFKGEVACLEDINLEIFFTEYLIFLHGTIFLGIWCDLQVWNTLLRNQDSQNRYSAVWQIQCVNVDSSVLVAHCVSHSPQLSQFKMTCRGCQVAILSHYYYKNDDDDQPIPKLHPS